METTTIFPIFEKCKNYTLDLFWKEMFIECSKNKFPKGMTYDSEKNVVILENEEFELPDDSKELFSLMMRLFKKELKIISSRDIKINKVELDEIKRLRQAQLNVEWKKIKPKAYRDQLIIEFVVRRMRELSLSAKEARELFSKIQTGISFKQIIPEDILYSEGEIKDISSLVFEPKKKKFKLTRMSKGVYKAEKINTVDRLQKVTDKYMRELTKPKV